MTNSLTSSNLTFKQYQIYFLISNSENSKYLIYSRSDINPRYIPNVMTQVNPDSLEELAWYHISRLIGNKEAIDKANKDKGRSSRKGTIKNPKQEVKVEDDSDTAYNIIQLKKVLRLKIKKSPIPSRYQPTAVLVTVDIAGSGDSVDISGDGGTGGNYSSLMAIRKDTEWVSGEEVLELAEELKGREKELIVEYLKGIIQN